MGVVVAMLGIWSVVRASMRKRQANDEHASYLKDMEGRGTFALWKALSLWVASSLAYVVLCKILVPDFPAWILCLFGFVLSPLLSYVSARMYGITGSPTGVSFPMVREGSFILSGYKGVEIWFAPVPYFNHGAQVQQFKILELTRVKFVGYVKMIALVFVLTLFTSFAYWALIWRMGPIPSSMYPFVQKMWPFFAKYKALWATSTVEGGRRWLIEGITLTKVGAGFGAAWVVYAITALTPIPGAFFYGFVGGVAMWPHYPVVLLVGALLGKFYFARRLGVEKWRRYTPVLAAGYYCGVGLIGMAAAAFALVGKAVTPLVF